MALAVTQQRREIDGLVGAIHAALGIDEGVGPLRHLAALDAAIAEVKRARFQAEEGVVGLFP